MAKIDGFKDLIAWQKGMDLVVEVYRLSAHFPPDERFGLTAQVRKAAVSIPSNVAEGYARPSRADYVHFLDISRGSANEVETQLLAAVQLGFVTSEKARRALEMTNEEQRILNGLVEALERGPKKNYRER
jgi:four helix bundle protein